MEMPINNPIFDAITLFFAALVMIPFIVSIGYHIQEWRKEKKFKARSSSQNTTIDR